MEHILEKKKKSKDKISIIFTRIVRLRYVNGVFYFSFHVSDVLTTRFVQWPE